MWRRTGAVGLALIWGAAASAQSINCDAAVDMVAMQTCVTAQFQEADAALNANYKAALAAMQSVDDSLPKAERGAVEALKTAQRAWITVRDNTCAAVGFLWAGGSGRGLAELSCRVQQTSSRAIDLSGIAYGE